VNSLSKIGIAGLTVMGENLVLNIKSKGFSVSVFNRTTTKTDSLINDSFQTARLPANLLQAQGDYFWAHTYERIDKPRGEFFHKNWTGTGGNTTSTAYLR